MVATAAAFMAVFVIMLMMVVMVVVMVMAAAAAFVVVVMMIMVVMFMVVVVTAAATAFAVFMIMMMVMMITVWLISCIQSACQQSGYCSICITGNSCINFDISVIQSNSCTHAHAAADQCGDTGLCQVACQRAVAKTIVSDYFAGNNCAVFYGINLKLFGTSEVLENLTVFVSYCNFHTVIPPHSDSGGSCSPVLCLHTKYNFRLQCEAGGFHTEPVPVSGGHFHRWPAP